MSKVEEVSGKKKDSDWQQRAIVNFWRKNEKALIGSGLVLVFAAVISAQVFLFNHTFVWANLEVFSTVSWDRILFSALTFLTIGRILYHFYFYKALSFLFHTILHDHRGYVAAKEAIWWALMLFMYFYVQPIVIKFLNIVCTVAYNIIAFLAYSLPALGITLLFFVLYVGIRRYSSLSPVSK